MTLPRCRSVLAVCAHPDDESFGLGAGLAAFHADGSAVTVLTMTHGESSTLGIETGETSELGEVRERELAAAARALELDRAQLLDHPDGGLEGVALATLAGEVTTLAEEVQADLILVFDEDGITGHPDHRRATSAAAVAAAERGVPLLAWTIRREVADALNCEFHAGFVGRSPEEIDLELETDREIQRRAIACHESQAHGNAVLWRRLELSGSTESFRWLGAERPVAGRATAPGARRAQGRDAFPSTTGLTGCDIR